MALKQITAENFQTEVLDSEGSVLVFFKSEGCPHCRRMEPVIESLAEEYAERVKFGLVDVGENVDLASQYDIMSVPTTLIFKAGELVDKVIGATSKEGIIQKL